MACGLLALFLFALAAPARWPGVREILVPLVGAGLMAAALAPLRGWQPGLATLLLQLLAGLVIYGAVLLAFDAMGLRSLALARLRRDGKT